MSRRPSSAGTFSLDGEKWLIILPIFSLQMKPWPHFSPSLYGEKCRQADEGSTAVEQMSTAPNTLNTRP